MEMSLNEIKFLTSVSSDKKYQQLTIVVTKNKYTGRYLISYK